MVTALAAWLCAAALVVAILLLAPRRSAMAGPGGRARRRPAVRSPDGVVPAAADDAPGVLGSPVALGAAGVLLGAAAGALLPQTVLAPIRVLVGVVVAALGVAVLAVGLPWVLRRRSRGADIDATDTALAADLLLATVSAGVPVPTAVRATAQAVGGPLGDRLRDVARFEASGAAPATACRALLADPATARLGRALARSRATGSSPVQVLAAAAQAERERRRSTRLARARGAGSVAALPLGLLFLPAFLLVAVVPIVVATLGSVVTGG